MKIEDRAALEKAETSLKYENGWYQVGIPWKDHSSELSKKIRNGSQIW